MNVSCNTKNKHERLDRKRMKPTIRIFFSNKSDKFSGNRLKQDAIKCQRDGALEKGNK